MSPSRRERTLEAIPGLRPEFHVVDARMAWNLGVDAAQATYRTMPWWKRLGCGSWRVPIERPRPPAFGSPLVFSAGSVACEWCGRAIEQDERGRWYAVKGAERGYPPLLCDANPSNAHAVAPS